MEKINIIQFMPYFPPHKGGVETVGQEMGINWVKNDLGKFINVVSEIPHPNPLLIGEGIKGVDKIVFQDEVIGYRRDGYEVLVCPSIEIINNFPVYKVWDKKYKLIVKYLRKATSPQPSPSQEREHDNVQWRVITHTRFFLTSLTGGLFARSNKLKWIHIEHGSDYVKLSSKLKSYLSVVYDRIFGKWIFKKADIVLGISEACKRFILDKFVEREVDVFYRGMEISDKIVEVEDLKQKFENKIIVGYVGRLYKWKNVESLIKAFYLLDLSILKQIQLVIVGDGEDFDRLKLLDKEKKVYFTGGKSFEEALSYQRQFDIHVHPSSPGGGLATTLLQAMNFGCYIVATPNEGAPEVVTDGVNGILLKDDSVDEIKGGIEMAVSGIDEKEKYAEESRRIIDEKFRWERNILKLYELVK